MYPTVGWPVAAPMVGPLLPALPYASPMMPAAAGAAGAAAAPAALVAALLAGVPAANSELVDRAPADLLGSLERNLMEHPKNEQLRTLVERERRRLAGMQMPRLLAKPEPMGREVPTQAGYMSGVEDTPSAPPGDVPRPPVGPVGTVAQRTGLIPSRGGNPQTELADRLSAIANAQSALGQQAAMQTYIPPEWNMKAAHDELVKNTKRKDIDSRHSRTMSDAVLAMAGQWLASEGRDIGGGVAKGVEAWTKGRDRDEARAQKDYETELAQGTANLGFQEKDRMHEDARGQAEAQKRVAFIVAQGIPYQAAKEIVNLQWQANDRALERAKDLQVAKISHGGKDPLQTFDAITGRIGAIQRAVAAQKGVATPQQAMQLEGLKGMMKAPKAEKTYTFDDANKGREELLRRMGGQAGSKKAGQITQLYDAFLDEGYSPQEALAAATKSITPN